MLLQKYLDLLSLFNIAMSSVHRDFPYFSNVWLLSYVDEIIGTNGTEFNPINYCIKNINDNIKKLGLSLNEDKDSDRSYVKKIW